MKTLLRNIRIIAIFAYWITTGFYAVNSFTTGEPHIYKQITVSDTVPIYKGSYANVQPSCTVSHKVIPVQTKCISYPLSKVPHKDIIFG